MCYRVTAKNIPARQLNFAVLAAEIARKNTGLRPNVVAYHVADLIRKANGLNTLNDAANTAPGLSSRQETRRRKLRQSILEQAQSLGLGVREYNTDPRGFAVKLDLPSGISNGIDDGWGL